MAAVCQCDAPGLPTARPAAAGNRSRQGQASNGQYFQIRERSEPCLPMLAEQAPGRNECYQRRTLGLRQFNTFFCSEEPERSRNYTKLLRFMRRF